MTAVLVVGGLVGVVVAVLVMAASRTRRRRDPYRALGLVHGHQTVRPDGHERSRHEFED